MSHRAFWKGRQVVYRLYGKDGTLLYIGCTGNWPVRVQTHRCRKTSFWWPLVHRARLTLHRSPREAADVEKAAIQTERPLYNLVDNFSPEHRKAKIHEWDLIFPGTAQAFDDVADKANKRYWRLKEAGVNPHDRASLREWHARRPGRGTRTDLKRKERP